MTEKMKTVTKSYSLMQMDNILQNKNIFEFLELFYNF